jgi:hypothetical protein
VAGADYFGENLEFLEEGHQVVEGFKLWLFGIGELVVDLLREVYLNV